MKKNLCMMAFIFFAQSACSADAITVQKSEEPEFKTTNYTAAGVTCLIAWAVRRSSHFKQGFSFSETSKCALPLAEQKPYRAALLTRLMADTNNLEGMRGFGWGGLQRGDATDEYASRMMAVVAKSRDWDSTKGKPTKPKGNPYFVLKKLINDENVFSEVVAVFSAKNLVLWVQDIEEMQIKSGKIKVPSNCIVIFAVKRK